MKRSVNFVLMRGYSLEYIGAIIGSSVDLFAKCEFCVYSLESISSSYD